MIYLFIAAAVFLNTAAFGMKATEQIDALYQEMEELALSSADDTQCAGPVRIDRRELGERAREAAYTKKCLKSLARLERQGLKKENARKYISRLRFLLMRKAAYPLQDTLCITSAGRRLLDDLETLYVCDQKLHVHARGLRELYRSFEKKMRVLV